MKILLAIIFISFFTQVDWVKDIEQRIENIDSNGKEVKSKIKEKKGAIITQLKINYDNFQKRVTIYKPKENYDFGFENKVYLSSKFIFATKSYVYSPIYPRHKNWPLMEIKETNNYFKNDSIGISYSREIDVFANQNIDSLKNELQKKDFVSTSLNNEDYKAELDKYKRMRKF